MRVATLPQTPDYVECELCARGSHFSGLTLILAVVSTSTTERPSWAHEIEFRVRYAETDQMGVVYHTNYLVWCEMGRTDFIRARGMSYAEMERAGIGLAVSELSARFHAAARYDDMIRVRTTLVEVKSRSITFDYLITKAGDGSRLVTARTALISIDRAGRPTALPSSVRVLFDSQ
jgi:acyl-CoA thioester hydrolase